MAEFLRVEEEFTADFHGTVYLINIFVSEGMLSLEVEDEETAHRWSAEFTSQYLEETTHKAGNYKSFSVYIQMLLSAFKQNNDNVYVDILTFSDLEMMKAKKVNEQRGNSQSNPALQASMRASSFRHSTDNKRYLILTYSNQYDKVHYPLPLPFEDTPNVNALQRTIRRLRKIVAEKDENPISQPNGQRERELVAANAQLRQDNQELRHKLKMLPGGGAAPATSPGKINMELAATNTKLVRKIEEIKGELHALTVAHENLRTKYAVDITKWKQKLGMSFDTTNNGGGNGGNGTISNGSMDDYAHEMNEMRRKLLTTERELKLLKLSKGVPVANNRNKASLHSEYAENFSHNNRQSRQFNRSVTPDSERRSNHTHNGNSISSARKTSTFTSHSDVVSGRERERPTRRTDVAVRSQSPYYSPHQSRSGSPYYSDRGSANSSGRKKKTHFSRHATPSPSTTRRVSNSRSVSPSSLRHASPASSLGGQFDPTAYKHMREQREIEAMHRKPFSPSGTNHTTNLLLRNNSHSRAPSPQNRFNRLQYDSHSDSDSGSVDRYEQYSRPAPSRNKVKNTKNGGVKPRGTNNKSANHYDSGVMKDYREDSLDYLSDHSKQSSQGSIHSQRSRQSDRSSQPSTINHPHTAGNNAKQSYYINSGGIDSDDERKSTHSTHSYRNTGNTVDNTSNSGNNAGPYSFPILAGLESNTNTRNRNVMTSSYDSEASHTGHTNSKSGATNNNNQQRSQQQQQQQSQMSRSISRTNAEIHHSAQHDARANYNNLRVNTASVAPRAQLPHHIVHKKRSPTKRSPTKAQIAALLAAEREEIARSARSKENIEKFPNDIQKIDSKISELQTYLQSARGHLNG